MIKIDGVPTSFTTLTEKKKKNLTYDTCHVTFDMWHMTCDMWNVTCDMWHVTGDQTTRHAICHKFYTDKMSKYFFTQKTRKLRMLRACVFVSHPGKLTFSLTWDFWSKSVSLILSYLNTFSFLVFENQPHHNGGDSRGWVCGCGCWRFMIGERWHATRDTWHVTCDTWHVTPDM